MNIKDFYKALKSKIKRYKIRPKSVTIDISNRCNAQCPFCSRQISEINTIKQICFAAFGEPLLHPDFDEFTDFVISKGYRLAYPTNMQLADKHFDFLLKATNIMFSIEGYDKETYEKSRVNLNFERTLNNIKEFDRLIREKRARKEKTPNREINCLITKESDIEKYFSLWGEVADIIRVGPILPVLIYDNKAQLPVLKYNENEENITFKLEKNVKNMYCNQIFNNINIRANGELALCCSDYDFNTDFGTYKDLQNSFRNNKNFNKIRKEFKLHQLEYCKNCPQNFEIDLDELFKLKPELTSFQKDPKVIIYSNR